MQTVRSIFDTNVLGMLEMCQQVVPHMARQGSGKIVNISSVKGIIAVPFDSIYSASKFAVIGMSDAMRLELAPLGIKVIVVQPGGIQSNTVANSEVNDVMQQQSV